MDSKFFNYALFFISLIFITAFTLSCKEDDPEPVRLPELTTALATDITLTTATLGGEITNSGGAEITARGVCWSTSQNPTTANSTTSNGSGTGAFTSSLTDLTPNTTYYVRAYATNKAGTAYGNEISFTTTTITLAELTTSPASNLRSTRVTVGGQISSSGNGNVTVRGICWSTNPDPTISDAKTEDGAGNGTFVSKLTNLLDATTYYVRAYATNEAGTAYGNQVSFTTHALQVFIAGNSSTSMGPWAPTFWKDGEPTQLNDGTTIAYGNSVTKSDNNDIHMAGTTFLNGENIATYWKNGEPTYLASGSSEGHGIVISGNDVYVSGKEHEDGYWRVKYWKNGVPTTVATAPLINMTSLTVAGNDVYIAASVYNDTKKKWIAKYWKNGQEVPLADGSSNTHAYSITVDGNDVYIAGTDDASPDNDPYAPYLALYWKNGVRVPLSDIAKDSEARSIVISGTDVYVAGREGSTLLYWKNGVAVPLIEFSDAIVYSIAVAANKVYVGATLQYNKGLMVWKNGELIMDLEEANVKGIFLY